MAIQLFRENDSFNIYHQHFLIDEENDLVNLENEYSCSMGDRAELPDGTIYVRHSDGYNGELWELSESLGENSKLPEVDSSDNGRVLMVVNGVWATASLPTYNGGVN